VGVGPPAPVASSRGHHDLTGNNIGDTIGGGIGDERTVNTNGIDENSMNRTPFSCGAEPRSRAAGSRQTDVAPLPLNRGCFNR
jgi:hypothetical protein